MKRSGRQSRSGKERNPPASLHVLRFSDALFDAVVIRYDTLCRESGKAGPIGSVFWCVVEMRLVALTKHDNHAG